MNHEKSSTLLNILFAQVMITSLATLKEDLHHGFKVEGK